MTYKTIVVGTDGSERAQVAENHAIALARSLGSQVHFVHVVAERIPSDPLMMDSATSMHLALDQSFDKGDVVTAAALARAEVRGVSGHVHSPVGNPANMLIDIAKAYNADLVVVGNRGMGGFRRFVLGSVASRIAHRCPCNLLVVNTDTQDEG